MDYNLGYTDDRRDTIDGKLALFDRYFSDTIEVPPSTLSLRSSKPAKLWNLEYTAKHGGIAPGLSFAHLGPSAALSPGLSDGLTEALSAEDGGDEPLWSPPLTSPAFSDVTFIDEKCKIGDVAHPEPVPVASCFEIAGLPVLAQRHQVPIGLPVSPRPSHGPVFVPSKTYHTTSSLNPQGCQKARRGSEPNDHFSSQARSETWLRPAARPLGPPSAPLPYELKSGHKVVVTDLGDHAGAKLNEISEPMQRHVYKIPVIRLDDKGSPARPSYLSSSSTQSAMRLPDFVISHQRSQFDPPPAPILPTFPLDFPPSPRTAGPSPIDTTLIINDQSEETPRAPLLGPDKPAKSGASTIIFDLPKANLDIGTTTTDNYKITRIQPSYPDFKMTTPMESEFDFPPPTPMNPDIHANHPIVIQDRPDHQYGKDSHETRSLFRKISPTFGRFSRRQSEHREPMQRRHSEPQSESHQQMVQSLTHAGILSHADQSAAGKLAQEAASPRRAVRDPWAPNMERRRSDKLSGIQNYFRSGSNKNRGVTLNGLETDFTGLNIGSPMGIGNGAPLSAVPESASSTHSDKFWW